MVGMAAADQPDRPWTPPRAVGANVLIVPERVDRERCIFLGSERDIPVDPVTGLLTAREIELHTGRIVGMGSWVSLTYPELKIGEYVVWQRDKWDEFDWDGVSINRVSMRTHCPRCHTELAKDTILGLL